MLGPREIAAQVASAGRLSAGLIPHLTRLASPHAVTAALRELRGLGTHVALYPLGFRAAPLQAHHHAEGTDTFELPVVMIHGYFHNRSGFFFMARALRRRGFRWVYAMNYNPLGESVSSLAARLAMHVDEVMRVSGAPKVHLIGHSLGGVIARWYVQEMGGDRYVDHCVTIGTPHRGTVTAFLGWGQTAREMRPGSSVTRRLRAGFSRCPTKFVNLYSDLDVLIIPPDSARLPESERVHNHLIHDLGHTSLLISKELIDVVTSHLADADVHTPLAEVRPLTKTSEPPCSAAES